MKIHNGNENNTMNNATEDFWRNIRQNVNKRGFHSVTLKETGRFTVKDVIVWAAGCGYAAEKTGEYSVRIAKRQAA